MKQVFKTETCQKSGLIIGLIAGAALFLFTACADNQKQDAGVDAYCSGSTSSFRAQVKQYPSSISDERIYMNETLGQALGAVVGQQVRIFPENEVNRYGLYTIADWYDGSSNGNVLWMDDSGWQRLNQDKPFNACVREQAFQYELSLDQLQAHDEFSCFLSETNTTHTGIVVGAPHGGYIEINTDDQAIWFFDQIAINHNKDVSAWYCAGYQSVVGSFDAWHITSTDISPKSFLLLDQIADRGFTYAVSFHGFSKDYYLIGGSAPESLKSDIKTAIESAVSGAYTVILAKPGDQYAGVSSKNFVNWLTANGANGIQIEQPRSSRLTYGKAVAQAVADVFAGKL